MENQDRFYDSAESMNQALLSLYESRLPELYKLIDQCGFETDKIISKLFFMQVNEAYMNAPKKILFVGRETFGWEQYNKLDTANDLTALYNRVSTEGEHYNSPFWWFREGFSEIFQINKGDFMKATLWTNLSKIDVDRQRPTGKPFDHLMQVFISLLISEIEIVKPEVILILTKDGFYNWHLDNYGWLQNEPFVEYKTIELERKSVLDKKIDRLIAPSRLPAHTYQICHPNALRRRAGGYSVHAGELINALAGQINP